MVRTSIVGVGVAALASAAVAGPVRPAELDRSGYAIYQAVGTEIGVDLGVERGATTYYSNMGSGTGFAAFPMSGIQVDGQLESLGVADYASTAVNNIDLNVMKFVGGVNQAGGVAFFDFYDAGGVFVDGFGVQFANAGNFIYTITINSAVEIAAGGFVEMLVDDENLAGAGSNAGGQWFLSDAAATIGSAGAFDANPNLNFKLELTGAEVPAPGALALLGLGGLAAGRRRR